MKCRENIQNSFTKEYWENKAKTFKASYKASWCDHFMINLEIETIGKQLFKNAKVLDVGCGNGYSTIRQFKNHSIKSIVGVDSSKNMIKQANKSKRDLSLGNDIHFEIDNIKSLKFKDNYFDIVYVTRVLINLQNWQEQIQAIEECLRVVKQGGKVVLSEAFWEPLILLNSLRTIKHLPPLVEHDFNRYIKKQRLEAYLRERNMKYEVDDFSSIYYLGSRFLRELVTDISQYPEYTNPINKIFYDIERNFSGGEFGIQQIYILYK